MSTIEVNLDGKHSTRLDELLNSLRIIRRIDVISKEPSSCGILLCMLHRTLRANK
jgi:hypothetical protein